MLAADDLNRSVDPYTGQVGFNIALIDLPGRNDLHVRLGISYSSAVRRTACGWNQLEPTGVLGLGWSLDFDRIFAAGQMSALQADRDIYLSLGGVFSRLVRIGTADDGGWTYGCENYVFWQIAYYPAQELWRVVDETGTVYLFGGAASGRGTVDWGVVWGGWSGPSGQTAAQHEQAYGWSLSQVQDRFGDRIVYSYLQDAATVGEGGSLYTQATYLATVVGVDGAFAQLHYENKDAVEYQCPHTNPSPPNAWQDRFQTRYLSRITTKTSSSQVIENIVFGYAPQFLGSGTLSKRLLASIGRYASTGILEEPATRFSYWGQSPADGVSAASAFNPVNGAYYGALKTATLAQGGTATYTYTGVAPQFSSRSAVVVVSATATAPRLYFSGDYVLATWLDGTSVRLQAYIWAGRWLKSDIATFTLAHGVDYADISVATGRDCCAVLAGKNLVVVGRDVANPGAWLPFASFNVPLADGEKGVLATGNDFACVLGQSGGTLYPFRLTGATWTEDGARVLGAAGNSFVMAAKGALVVAGVITASGGPTSVTLMIRGGDGMWANPSTTALDLGSLAGNGGIVLGDGFAVLFAAQAIATGQCVRYGAVSWDENGTNLQASPWLTMSLAAGAKPVVPVVAGAGVALPGRLFRFDGARWNTCDVHGLREPGTAGLLAAALGADLYARLFATSTAGTQCADLMAYDPLAASWSVPQGLAVTGTAPLAATAVITEGSVGNYAAVGNVLWHRAADGTWSAVLSLPGGLSESDIASLRVVSDRFAVLQQGTGSASVKTRVYLLANGSASATPIDLAGQQFVWSGYALIGMGAFATYSGTYGDAHSTLTLYRPVGGDLNDVQTAYVAATVTLDGGYGGLTGTGASPTAVVCNPSGATIDEAGYLPQFNQTTVYPGTSDSAHASNGSTVFGYYNGLSANEAPAEPWPDTQYGNALSYAAAAQGCIFVERMCDAAGNPVAQYATYWQVTAGTLGVAGRSAYTRAVRRADMRDGATGITTISYRSDTGFPDTETVQTYNAAGTIDSFATQYTYWWQIYDPARAANMLAPVVQTTRLSTAAGGTPVKTGISVETWRQDWGYWAPDRSFVATSASAAAFAAWQPGDPQPDGYLLQQRVRARTSFGLPLAIADSLGNDTSFVYDIGQTKLVAGVRNCPADTSMFVWFGCEPYEASGGWNCADPSRSVWSFVTTADYHTGSQCLLLPPATTAGPQLLVQPADQSRVYVFTCWARAAQGFAPGRGLVQWTIQPFNAATGQATGQPIILNLTPQTGGPSAVSGWEYFQATIDLPSLAAAAGKALGLRISATNANTEQACFVDELRFQPQDSSFYATVYNSPLRKPQGSIDNTGQSVQLRYDPTDSPYLAIAPYDRIAMLEAYSYSRAQTAQDTFQSAFPNTHLRLTTSGGSRYYDFHDGLSTDWTFSDIYWAIANGELVYSGTSTVGVGATADLSRYAYTYFAAAMRVVSPAADGKIALGNGDVYMQWDQRTQSWALVRISGTTVTTLQTNAVVPFGAQWLFSVIDGWVVCFAGATQVFAYQYDMPSPVPPGYGRVHIAATGAARFDDVALMDSPQLVLAFIDGMGEAQQTLDFVGVYPAAGSTTTYPGQATMLANGVFLDELRRPVVQRLGIEAPVKMASPLATADATWNVVQGGSSDYLRTDTGTALTMQQYLSGSSGYTYASTSFEPSPLSRVSRYVPPRAAGSDGSRLAVTASYGTSTTVGAAPVIGSGKYRVSTASWVQCVDAGGVQRQVMQRITRDTLGRVLMRQDGAVDSLLRQTGFGYDTAGRLATIYHPNYYAPPGPSTADAWKDTIVNNFLGQVVSHISNDRGQIQAMYDSAGRTRFILDAEGAAQTPVRILYTKYDALDRPVETGYIWDANVGWNAALQVKADVASFPVIQNQPAGPDQVSGMWCKRFACNGGTGADARFLLGRLRQVSLNQNGSPDTPDVETYRYDAYGNLIAKTVVMPNISPAVGWTVTAAYNGLNQIASLVYPAFDDTPPSIVFSYDRHGRVAAVGTGAGEGPVVDPSNPPLPPEQRWSAYSYDMFGRFSAVSYNNVLAPEDGAAISRVFGYDASQRLNTLRDPYFMETLAYDNGQGIDGWRYCDGSIEAIASQYFPSAVWNPAIPNTVQRLQYDAYGQLTSAINTLGAAYSIAPGGAMRYDANGNVLASARGSTGTAWSYSGTQAAASDRLATIASTVNAAVDFNTVAAGAKSSDAWIWGSNNGGPSASGLMQVLGPAETPIQVLKLAGGGLGHYEALQLFTYLQPQAAYTLSWQAKTDAGYGQAIGGAVWYLVLQAESGPSVALPLQNLAASDWQTGSLSFTPTLVARDCGFALPVVAASVELRNSGRSPDGASGPAVLLANAAVTGSISGEAYSYNANGQVTAAPDRGITTLTYNPVTKLTTSISLVSSDVLAFSYGADNGRSRVQVAGAAPRMTVTLTGMRGEVLATKTTGAAANYYLHGPEGVFGRLSGGRLRLLLADHLGSPRVEIDAPASVPLSVGDYMPFGDAVRRTAPAGTDIGFTGQRLDVASGLYNYNARFYDPSLGRFYSPDAAAQYASPYVYVGNNPLSFTDPSGNFAYVFWGAVAAAGLAIEARIPELYSWIEQPGKRLLDHYANEGIPLETWSDYPLMLFRYPRRILAQLFKNISHQEMQFMRDFPYQTVPVPAPIKSVIWPVRFAISLLKIYHPIEQDISRNYEDKEKMNAARHFAFMCRGIRSPFGSREYALKLGLAHEAGRPGWGSIGLTDGIADKLNNEISAYKTVTFANRTCHELFDESWGARGGLTGILSLNGEVHLPETVKGRQVVLESYLRSIGYLSEHNVTMPEFTLDERTMVDEALALNKTLAGMLRWPEKAEAAAPDGDWTKSEL